MKNKNSILENYILSIDQGTSGTKAIIFNTHGEVVTKATEPLKSHYPETGFVEQDPEEIYRNVLAAVEKCYSEFRQQFPEDNHKILSCGISNQRETFVVWDGEGKPLHQAVVWQCKRSNEICTQLQERQLEDTISSKTGLIIDPYFSATKVVWLYQNHKNFRNAVDNKDAFFGTIDTWLLFRLTKGKKYYTDHTNASRTLFYNIYDLKWDAELLEAFELKNLQLPEVKSSASHYGASDFGGVFNTPLPITGMIGDSHAAFFGEECYKENMAKATLGTGSSILWNAGEKPISNNDKIMTTIGWSTSKEVSYAYEGIIVSAGSTLEWLKNQMNTFSADSKIEIMAQGLSSNEGVYIIPAFSGMGAPYWEKNWKASIHGLTFGTTKEHLVRAGLESIAYQIKDVINAIEKEKGVSLKELKVDGGMTGNRFLLQYLSNVLGKNVVNIGISDVSAYGAALISGLGAGLWKEIDSLPRMKPENRKVFQPKSKKNVDKSYKVWKQLLEHKYY
ncbi:FGGY-family carbohydrate kinase [Autumnicola musiva]|uniref:ATP:glycerol 3-phosphotransferase n=1 Tax=Autumnicola musiva TaxID=3075589 RepID=A0ABU3D7X5_9FLAO|nr:glycerol kinase GlpK [Zunongwangia sp. F117]MDT0677632.1 glycerol kinase GlpK [Zunongwangia sp. F117]